MSTLTTLMRGVKHEGDDGGFTAVTYPVLIRGVSDESAALGRIKAEYPAEMLGMPRVGIDITAIPGGGQFKGSVRYQRDRVPGNDQLTDRPGGLFSFEAGGETEHVNLPLETVAAYGDSRYSPLAGLINYDDSGINGVDVYTRSFTWSETHYFKPDFVDEHYKGVCDDLVCTVNSRAFRGKPAGEVLLRRITGSRRGTRSTDLWEINFQFERRRNRKNFNIGGIQVAEKRGWDYLWCYHVPATVNGFACRQVAAVFIERLYESGNFGELGI